MSLTTIIGQNDDGTYVVKHKDREFKGTAEAMAVHLGFHMEEIERLQSRLAIAEKVVEWQPIETAPKDGTWVILYTPDAAEEKVQAGYWGPSYFDYDPTWLQYAHRSDCEEVDGVPTHWMPLPPPPTSLAAHKEAQ